MSIKKEVISNRYLVFLYIQLVEASSLIGSFVSRVTKQDTWMVVIVSCTITFFLLMIYLNISASFPDKTIIEINDIVYGKYLGKGISLAYINLFWFIVASDVRFVGDFFNVYLFPETDIVVFAILIMGAAIYAVSKGLEGIVRITSMSLFITFCLTIFLITFTLRYVKLSNLLPLFQLACKDFIQGVNILVAIPAGSIIVLLMIFPAVKDKKTVKGNSYLGFFLGEVYFLVIVFRNTLVLGNIASMHINPTYQVARLAIIGDIVTRSESLAAMVLFFGLFIRICLFLYATVLALTQIFKLNSYRASLFPVGIISSVLSISMFSSQAEHIYSGAYIYPIFVIPVVIILPAITLIIVYIEKSIKKSSSLE